MGQAAERGGCVVLGKVDRQGFARLASHGALAEGCGAWGMGLLVATHMTQLLLWAEHMPVMIMRAEAGECLWQRAIDLSAFDNKHKAFG